jgi:hypothetical protein
LVGTRQVVTKEREKKKGEGAVCINKKKGEMTTALPLEPLSGTT